MSAKLQREGREKESVLYSADCTVLCTLQARQHTTPPPPPPSAAAAALFAVVVAFPLPAETDW